MKYFFSSFSVKMFEIIFLENALIFPKNCVEYNIDVYKCCELSKRRCGICVHDTDFSMCSNAQKRGALWILDILRRRNYPQDGA